MTVIDVYAIAGFAFGVFVAASIILTDRGDRRAERAEDAERASATGRFKPLNRGRR